MPDTSMLAQLSVTFYVLIGAIAVLYLSWRSYSRQMRESNLALARDGDAARSIELLLKVYCSWLPLSLFNRWVYRGDLEAVFAAHYDSLGEMSEAIEWCNRGLRVARKPQLRATLHGTAATIHAHAGDRSEFEKHLRAFIGVGYRGSMEAFTPDATAVYGESMLGRPDHAWKLLCEIARRNDGKLPASTLHRAVGVLHDLGAFDEVFKLTGMLCEPAASPRAVAKSDSVGVAELHAAQAQLVNCLILNVAMQSARWAGRWDLYEQYLNAMSEITSTLPRVRAVQLGATAIWLAHRGDCAGVESCIQGMQAEAARVPRDRRIVSILIGQTAVAWTVLDAPERALAALQGVSHAVTTNDGRSGAAALAAENLEKLGQHEQAEAQRAEARRLAPTAFWSEPPESERIDPAAISATVDGWLAGTDAADVHEAGAAAAQVASIAPVASGTAHAACVLMIAAMAPVIGVLGCVALLTLGIILLTRANPLPLDRRVGWISLAVCAAGAALFVLQIWSLLDNANTRLKYQRELARIGAEAASQPADDAALSTQAASTEPADESEIAASDEDYDEEAEDADAAPAERSREKWTRAAIIIVVLILSVMLHEIGHAVAAYWGGDPTARDLGRFSLNPIRHISLIGSVIVPLILYLMPGNLCFGWAKPVPVRFERLRHRRRGQLAVSLAGVSANLLLALVAAQMLIVIGILRRHLFPDGYVFGLADPRVSAWAVGLPAPILWNVTAEMLKACVIVNAVLIGLNLLPIPPLDGFNVVRALLSERVGRSLARYTGLGMVALLVLIATDALSVLLYPAIGIAVVLLAFADHLVQ